MDADDDALSQTSAYSSASSSSSDDDFLTPAAVGGGAVTQQDREALVRKKLLESFYGASPGAGATTPGGAEDVVDEDGNNIADKSDGNGVDGGEGLHVDGDDDIDEEGQDDFAPKSSAQSSDYDHRTQQSQKQKFKNPSQIPLPFTATKSDLDSPNFQPHSHTLSHIAHSTAHTLLETNERLALDIRTLDSTMQTLVYENYSKFIDATDAIKSIGTNVSSVSGGGDTKNGLDRLISGMNSLGTASERSERLLRHSREAVAEKLRIQRLLTRLDALLSLPSTLRTYISQGKYRMAVQSHLSATEILGRHSAGFESLRSIELECGEILTELVNDLKERLIEWSGGSTGNDMGYNSSSLNVTVSSPKSIAEIFECAGTLLMLHPTSFSPGLDKNQCQSLALAACGQYLNERLVVGASSSANDNDSPSNSPGRKKAPVPESKNDLDQGIVDDLPISFLDGILESTTLYGLSFQVADHGGSTPSTTEHELLARFVSTSFDKFISHVKMLLIEQSDQHIRAPDSKGEDDEKEAKDDANFLQISIALSHLLRSVRELASGLALPEVGLDVSIASALVDQTVELAEMLVRRRVAMKFNELRAVVVKECLASFVNEVIGSNRESDENAGNNDEEEDSERGTQQSFSLMEIIQLASVALSDGLQMADDLIRATLERSQLSGGAVVAPVDSAVVKLAVQRSAKLFGVWLASTLEQLVGCEPSFESDSLLLEVWEKENEEDSENGQKRIIIPKLEKDEGTSKWNSVHSTSFSRIDSSEDPATDEASSLLNNLLVQLDNGASEHVYSNFLLGVCEMCRLAERSLANTLNQSIQSAMEEDARVADSANTLFGDTINPHRKGKDGLDSEQILSKRFQLAASRALSMYIMNRGSCAAAELCTGMHLLSDARDPYAIPSRPREVCLKVFEMAKAACEDCISIMGGDLFVAPMALFPEEVEYVDVFGDRLAGATGGSGGGASRGLQLDVERMFVEKVTVYPEALTKLDFTRNSVVSGILRVALSAFLECIRSSVFSSLGYRQMKVDAIFMRYIVPHYVKDEFGTPEQNACSSVFTVIDDIMLKAGQRCFDHEVTNDDDYYDVEKDEIFTPFQLVECFVKNSEDVLNRVAFS